MTVDLGGDEAHMNEVWIEDQLVVINRRAGENQAEGLDEAFTGGGALGACLTASVQRGAPANIEVTGAADTVLRVGGSMGHDVVETFGTIAAGDNHWKPQCLTKRFHSAKTQTLEILYGLHRRRVLDTMLTCRPALSELVQAEMRR